MIVYAHRGASEYAPENTKAAFDLGIALGANGIETDLQLTKDGRIVLFHDNTIDKKSNATGQIGDYTLTELMQMDFGAWFSPEYSGEKILTFEDFCGLYLRQNLTFAIEIKHVGFEKQVIEILNRYDCYHKIYITSFLYDAIKTVKTLCPKAETGWLVSGDIDSDKIHKLKTAGGTQICPDAVHVTEQGIALARQNNLSVRLWGVQNTDILHKVFTLDTDGMTVNFPDKLIELLKK